MAYKVRRGETVGLASTSDRRKKALQQIPEVEVIAHPGGHEDNTDDLVRVALSKIAYAYPALYRACMAESRVLAGVIAADTNTSIGVLRNGKPCLVRKTKPGTVEETRKHFIQMSARAEKCGEGYYEVTSSAAVQISTEAITGTEITQVTLHQGILRALAEPEGFLEYLSTFADFYQSEAYADNGLPPISPTNLSAGISLPVLLKMGAVKKVDGVDISGRRTKEIDETIHRALLNVAVGFSPRVINALHPEAMSYLFQWSWLQNAANEALNR